MSMTALRAKCRTVRPFVGRQAGVGDRPTTTYFNLLPSEKAFPTLSPRAT